LATVAAFGAGLAGFGAGLGAFGAGLVGFGVCLVAFGAGLVGFVVGLLDLGVGLVAFVAFGDLLAGAALTGFFPDLFLAEVLEGMRSVETDFRGTNRQFTH
jgi:hypothetical protein